MMSDKTPMESFGDYSKAVLYRLPKAPDSRLLEISFFNRGECTASFDEV